jgi:hypothetical protein
MNPWRFQKLCYKSLEVHIGMQHRFRALSIPNRTQEYGRRNARQDGGGGAFTHHENDNQIGSAKPLSVNQSIHNTGKGGIVFHTSGG